MKRILIPIDFTSTSVDALLAAMKLYGDSDARYYLLNTYNIPYVSPEVPLPPDETSPKIAQESFTKLMIDVRGKFPKQEFNITPIFKFGPFVSLIPQVVKDEKIDLIVMGTNKVSKLKEFMIGSNTSSVIDSIRCPLLTVPDRWQFEVPKRVILALDTTEKLNKLTIDPLMDLIDETSAELSVFHMVNSHSRGDTIDRKFLGRLLDGRIYEYIVEEGENATTTIENFLTKENADLICTIKHDHNIIKTLFHVSVTRKLSMHTAIPLLALHENIYTL